MTYVFRFIRLIKKRIQDKSKVPMVLLSQNTGMSVEEAISIGITKILTINNQEFLEVKNKLIHITQLLHYKKEFQSLFKYKNVNKKSSLYPLNPYLDCNNIIRANGRISNSVLPYKERQPIILPVNSHFCKLFIGFSYCHEKTPKLI